MVKHNGYNPAMVRKETMAYQLIFSHVFNFKSELDEETEQME
jgi:hypothetical protein